jgi:hypothetical protein
LISIHLGLAPVVELTGRECVCFTRRFEDGLAERLRYFDEALYQRESQTLFGQGPRYVGHTLSAVSEKIRHPENSAH